METEQKVSRPGVALGRLFGFPLSLSPSWFIMAALIMLSWVPVVQRRFDVPVTAAFAVAAGLVLSFFLSVLLHELGHAFVARRYGVGVRGITLDFLGGYTEMDREAPRPGVEVAYSLAGPAVSFILGLGLGAAWLVTPSGSITGLVVGQLAFSNLLVAVYNSLPGLPLDGGRALRAIVWASSGNQHTGTIVAGWAGRVVAIGTVLAAFFMYQVLGWSLTWLLVAGLIALSLWQGASAAMAYAKIAYRYPLIDPVRLARPLYVVPSGTSLAEASRRAGVDGRSAAALGVADSSGKLVAIVLADAAAAVPEQRRPWVSVETVARSVEGMPVIASALRGEEVINAVRADPAEEFLVTTGEDVVGVLRLADLVHLLDPRAK
ncbi:Zn-dependent protease [Allocatelliglobosispora scoriae]|uniref:Zinc metalloprotease n=1 Tax=Allocatelliglobosispora scoriae TaxID=643052 RepID=A0A841BXH2_9ACTN|nr:site-2 protease family protein [Allocatelliglobosispora scoriae]MBB5873847.1 Zn-dependent protease [Allocatelliglobosispora scoriae]